MCLGWLHFYLRCSSCSTVINLYFLSFIWLLVLFSSRVKILNSYTFSMVITIQAIVFSWSCNKTIKHSENVPIISSVSFLAVIAFPTVLLFILSVLWVSKYSSAVVYTPSQFPFSSHKCSRQWIEMHTYYNYIYNI